ncbi:MAG: DUF6438 domain-containing protein [Flavobacteriales bacterium]
MNKILISFTLFICVAMVFSCKSTSDTSSTAEPMDINVEIDEGLQTNIESIDTLALDEEPEALVFLTYSRGYCFGMCPVFNSSILTDGTVQYEGINFVDVMGNNSGQLKGADLKLIKDKLKEINYFELDSVYDNEMVMDIPAVRSSANLAGKSHSILDRYKGPKELNELYKLLDNLFSQLEWTPVSETE